jgi:hypothetical protein
MRTKSRTGKLSFAIAASLVVLGAATDNGPLLLGGSDAHAVIGRPLTPVSYAGVARRTTRRSVYAGAATGYAYPAPTAVVASSGVVTALPANCAQQTASGTIIYQCGSVAYRPYYSGSTLVYQPI